MTLYLLKFNNYYNRLVKAYDRLEYYKPYVVYTLNATNFNPADGVNTNHVVGVGNVEVYDGAGDYLIAVEGTDTIVSRWFIIESTRTRAGQYQLTLHRDLIVDYYNVIKQSPIFIEKAILPESDNFIFNNEDMTFNQIKTSQTPLFDETGCPWVVGYIPRDSFSNPQTVEASISLTPDIADITIDSMDTWVYRKYINEDFNGYARNLNYNVYVHALQNWTLDSGTQPVDKTITGTLKFTVNQEGYAGNPNWPKAILRQYSKYAYEGWSFDGKSSDGTIPPGYNTDYAYPAEQSNALRLSGKQNLNDIDNYYINTFLPAYRRVITSINEASLTDYGLDIHTYQETDEFLNLYGKILYEESTQKYFKITTSVVSDSPQILHLTVNQDPNSLYAILSSNLATGDDTPFIIGNPDGTSFAVEAKIKRYRLYLRELDPHAFVTLNSNRLHLDDSPYDIFCMPYSDTFEYKVDGQIFTANKSMAKNIATEIGADTGSGNIYDIQLLPYCPIRYCIREDGSFDALKAPVHLIYDSQEDPKNAIGAVFWANTSTFSFPLTQRFTATNLKISSQTDLWRLCSPNGSGMFDFNVAKNGGIVEHFNVDCTYKPFNPYIHIAPDFNRLYGRDFNDYRGLTCGGDFSLAQLSNAWSNYELNNKNYQAMFDRNVQSMELNNSVQKKMDIANAIAGTVSGAATGATAGAAAGGIGALVGGIVGAAGAGITGAMDVKYNDMLRKDALDLTKDQFGYQLGNIQAIPTSITKTSALTANNPLVPYVEYYTCSDKEKQALQNKIKYNGMTVMRIGTIQEFLQNEPSYIKGRLIRIEYIDEEGKLQNSIDDDYHLINSIANELNQGVYI